jgi:hypothetical protein
MNPNGRFLLLIHADYCARWRESTGVRRFPLNTVMEMIEFVFASEQSDCSRAAAVLALASY